MLAIENDEMAGEALRVTFQNKIDFPFSNKRAKM